MDLKPGDVLFVPRHWWHSVESLTNSIAVNTWLPHPEDAVERVKEAVVNFFIYLIINNYYILFLYFKHNIFLAFLYIFMYRA